MCGIAGFVVNRPRENRLEVLGRMTAALRHRGPDDEGAYIDDHVALGVRRLAVIDPAGGRQPIANEDGTIQVVLNGEIYNFAPLRDRLERRGHRFRTRSDAEVIVHAYEESGAECVHDLDGMFAFALWDGTRQSLLLARDRKGEKPLYYHAGPDVFVFGSELRALLQHPDVPATLSLRASPATCCSSAFPHPIRSWPTSQSCLRATRWSYPWLTSRDSPATGTCASSRTTPSASRSGASGY